MGFSFWKDYVNILNDTSSFEPSYWLKPIEDLNIRLDIVSNAFLFQSKLDLKLRSMPYNFFDSSKKAILGTHHLRGREHGFFKPDIESISDFNLDSFEYISGDVIYLGWLIPHYGHFLMESLSRCWVFNEIKINSNFKFLFNYYNDGDQFLNNKKWAVEFLTSFGIESDKVIFSNKPSVLERLYVPSQSMILHSNVNSLAQNYIWSNIKESFGPFNDECNRKIYLSRKKLKKDKRFLINEDEVESVFCALGFEIIYPEELSLREQIHCLDQAKVVAGPSGSALHNAAFMRPGQLLISLTTTDFCLLNEVLCCYSAKTQYELFFGESSGKNDGIWSINCIELDTMLKSHDFVNNV